MFGIVIGLFTLMVGILFISFIETEITLTQADSYTYGSNITRPGLHCGSNSSNPNLTITDGAKLTCLVTEAVNPYFIVILISIALGYITSQFKGESQ